MARGTAKTGQFNFQSVSPPTALARPLKMGTSACHAPHPTQFRGIAYPGSGNIQRKCRAQAWPELS
jgi:hypothetical protein